MEESLIVDSDILIDYLKEQPEAVFFLEQNIEKNIYISAITVAEIYARKKSQKEEIILNNFFQTFNIIEISENIAKQAGIIKNTWHKSHGIGFADAIVAATTQNHNLTLVTLNKKHYPMINNILIPYTKK